MLQQGEIDVLGLQIENGSIKEIYGIDIAFHEGGLNYGGTLETAGRVLKKIIRTALLLYGYFNVSKGHIIFSSPKISNSTLITLEKYIKELNGFFEEIGLHFHFKLYANHKFKEAIFDPVIKSSKVTADTSELFM